MKKKILYLMHVPWGWVKQRPHFIAENLGKNFDLTICHTQVFVRKLLTDNPLPEGCRLLVLPMLRMAHYEPIKTVNRWRLSKQMKRVLDREVYDIIWIQHPDMFRLVETLLPPSTKVICDCMDDYLQFPDVRNNRSRQEILMSLERRMLDRADVIFASSEHLAKVLNARHCQKKEIFVVNNAISITSKNAELCTKKKESIEKLKRNGFSLVTYIGTVAEWLDFGLMLDALERFPHLAFLLFGPVETKVPTHDRIMIFGPIPHNQVYAAMDASDALVMPFQVTPLIQSVDPVKLYEYVYSCKPTVVVAYGESEKFEEYVDLYRNDENFMQLVQKLVDGQLASKQVSETCKSFAENNTWEARVKLIAQYL